MRTRRLLLTLACCLFLLPSLARAQFHQESTLLTATAATATQSTEVLYKPTWATGLLLVLDVTAGSTLALDIALQAYSPGATSYADWVAELPDTEITGVTTFSTILTPFGIVTGGHYSIDERLVMIPPIFRLQVRHDNANAATYVLYGQWVK